MIEHRKQDLDDEKSKLSDGVAELRSYRSSWESVDVCKGWLQRNPRPHKENEGAYCKVCEKTLYCHLKNLKDHAATKAHRRKFADCNPDSNLTSTEPQCTPAVDYQKFDRNDSSDTRFTDLTSSLTLEESIPDTQPVSSFSVSFPDTYDFSCQDNDTSIEAEEVTTESPCKSYQVGSTSFRVTVSAESQYSVESKPEVDNTNEDKRVIWQYLFAKNEKDHYSYRSVWETTYDWIERVPGDESLAHCTLCNKNIKAKSTVIKYHGEK